MDWIDVNLFQFDYDLTWAAVFLNHYGHVYARYGARAAGDAEALISIQGLKTVARKVLEAHRKNPTRRPRKRLKYLAPLQLKTLQAARKTKRAGNCTHCHQVSEFLHLERGVTDRRKFRAMAREFYPLPENIGITLDRDLGNVVIAVQGAAEAAGIRVDDELIEIEKVPVYSAADVSWALHNVKTGSGRSVRLSAAVLRNGRRKSFTLKPTGPWKERDASWRASALYFGKESP